MIDTLLNPQELQLLLSVNTAIATIRDRKELFATIFEKIKQVLPVDDPGILILDKTCQYWQDWTNVDNYQNSIAATQLKQLGYDRFQPMDQWMEYTLHHTGIMTVAHFMQAYPKHPFGPVMWEAGLREFIFTPLMYRGKKLGVLFFDSLKEGTYNQAHIPLFEAIASQLAVAVANILAHEEIVKREQENAILLSVSQAIAAIHKKEELLQFIFRKVQPLFNFYDIGLAIISVPDNTITDWAVLMPELSPSATNQALLEAGLFTLPYQGSAIEKTIRDIENAGSPVIISLNENSISQFPDFKAILEIELSHGYKEMWFAQLKAGGKLLGTLNFNSLQADYFHKFDPQFFQAIADLVAIAVANILANEEILEREKEKTILLSISESLATIRDKQQLLKVVFEKVRPLFGFDDTGFFVLDPNRQYIEDWSVTLPEVDHSEANNQLRDSGAGRIPFARSVMEWVINQLRETNGPKLFYYNEEVFGLFPDYPQFEIIQQAGYQESIAALLRTDKQEMGILFFNSLQKGHFQASQLGIFQSIADLIAVAVANILANEEILQREREKAQLLEITELIAQVKATDDLLKLIVKKIKPLFGFHDCGLFVVSADGKTHSDLATLPEVDPSMWNQINEPISRGISHPGSLIEWLMQEIEKANGAVLLDFKDLVARFPDYPQFRGIAILDMGYRDCLAANLTVRGKVIGLFCINALQKGFFQPAIFSLFQSVTHTISIAVANILANEEILEREKEKAILLSISEDIAAVRNKEELLQLIIGKIKPLFHFYDCGILVIDNNGQFHDLAAIHPAIDNSEVNHQLNRMGFYESSGITYAGSKLEWLIAKMEQEKAPVVFDYHADHSAFTDSALLEVLKDLGYQESLFGLLKTGGKTFGCFSINYCNRQQIKQIQIPLFQNVVDQLSVAVANILAHEEILEREWEKTNLLSISEALSRISNRKELFRIIYTHIRTIFSFDDTGLFLINESENYHQLLVDYEMVGVPAEWQGSQDQISHCNSVIDFMAKGFGIISIDEAMRRFPGHPHEPVMRQAGFKEFIYGPLIYSGKTIGVLCFQSLKSGFYTNKDLRLFQNIANQLAVAVANILASEEIMEREKEKSMLLKVSQAIARIENIVDLLRNIDELLQPVFRHCDAGVLVVDRDKKYMLDYYTLYADAIPFSQEAKRMNTIAQEQGLVRMPLAGSLIEWAMGQPPMMGKLTDLLESGYDAPYLPHELDNGYSHYLCAPLTVSGNTFGFFNLLFKPEHQPIPPMLPLFSQMADMIAVALSNILANQELLEREREKTNLLSISEAMSAVQDRRQLLEVIFNKIKPVFAFADAGLFVLDKDERYHQDLVTDYQLLDTSAVQELNAANIRGRIEKHAAVDYFMQQGPLIEKVAEILNRFPGHPHFQAIVAAGYSHIIGGPLRHSGKDIGMLCFFAEKNSTYHENCFPLFRAISDQLSVAVANILANEEILHREWEKGILLSISSALVTIQERKQLFRVIYDKIRPIFPYDSAGIFIVNETGNTHYELTDEYILNSTDEMLIEKHIGRGPFKHQGSTVEYIMNHSSPLLLDMQRFEKENPHPHIPLMLEVGYRQLIAGSLVKGNKKFGMLCFNSKTQNFYSEKDIPLFGAIAEQLAIVVANILANEEIIEREREKTNLLSISEAISKINNRQELLRVVYQHIQPIFPFDSAGLFVMDEEKDVIYEILDSEAYPDALQKHLTEAGKLGPWKLSHTNKKSWWVQQDIITNTINQEAIYASGHTGEEQFKAGLIYGLQHMIGGPMYANGKRIGAICFSSKLPDFYSNVHISMFRSISGQVAVAVANILANEEIAAREKIKSIQVEIGKALAEETHWQNRLLRLARLVQMEIPYTLFLTSIMGQDQELTTYGFYKTGKDEYQVLDKDDLHRISALNAEQYKQYWQYVSNDLAGPTVYGPHEINSIQNQHPVRQKFMQYFRLQHTLLFPMQLSNNKLVVFALFSKENIPYHSSHILLLRNIQNYTGLCFDRVLAYDELEKANQRIKEENKYLQEEIKNEHNFDSIIGESRVLKEIFKNVSLVAATDTTVLVLGETGTGKELIARSLHNSSPRAKNPFIKINCAALPAQLIESELFGHEKGSFTGAFEKRTGKFELANGGSIFLDEIGELPLELQSKLLRVIQEKEFERIGGKQTLKCDVRIIAATNRKLETEVENGRFRADLYYRLNVFPILLPPLRDRKEDIPLLATYFAHKFCKKMNKPFRGISSHMLEILTSYQWPGNIRELENVMEQAVIVSPGTSALELARALLFVDRLIEEDRLLPNGKGLSGRTLPLVKEEREKMEIQAITEALQKSKGRIRGRKGAAQMLDIQPTTLESKMKKYGISKYEFGGLASEHTPTLKR